MNEAKKARNDAKKSAMLALKKFVDESKNPDLVKAMQTLKPSLYGLSAARGGGSAMGDRIVKLVAERKQVSEEELFKVFKVGRKEAGAQLRKHLKKANPVERIWIEFNAEKGTYTHKGTGKDAPQGWTGFVPVENNLKLNPTAPAQPGEVKK